MFDQLTIIRDTFFNLDVITATWPLLMSGLVQTLLLTLVSVPIAALAGLALATVSETPSGVVRFAAVLYIDFFRSIPPLILLIFIFYALPLIGVDLPQFASAVLAIGLNTSAYYAEIFRAGLESVPPGQREAGRSTGLSWFQTMLHVVYPPAIRNVMPDLLSNTVELFKLTSIASVVAMQDLLRAAQVAQGMTFNPSPLMAAAAIYIAIAWPFIRIISRMQRRELPKSAR